MFFPGAAVYAHKGDRDDDNVHIYIDATDIAEEELKKREQSGHVPRQPKQPKSTDVQPQNENNKTGEQQD